MDHTPDSGASNNIVISACVDCLKVTYAELRNIRVYYAKRYISVKHETRLWKLAVSLLRANVSPLEYLDWCFDRLLERHDDVAITMICAPSMLARYNEAAIDRSQEVEVLVRLQANLIKKREEKGEVLDKILLDEDAQISAVMRFAVAYSRGRGDLAENFRSDAERQLMFRPHYRQVLNKYLPEGMR